jgi:hypothetical protein
MHGLIFAQLQKYAEAEHGAEAWPKLLERANLKDRVYLPIREYPDADLVALILAAASISGTPVSAVIEDFGGFLVPSLIKMYGHLLKPTWKTLDVIAHTEDTVHAVVRVKNPGATPAHVQTKHISPTEVLLVYNSPRRLCALAIGIGKGLARHFGESIEVSETTCMHKGADHCEITFRKVVNQ